MPQDSVPPVDLGDPPPQQSLNLRDPKVVQGIALTILQRFVLAAGGTLVMPMASFMGSNASISFTEGQAPDGTKVIVVTLANPQPGIVRATAGALNGLRMPHRTPK